MLFALPQNFCGSRRQAALAEAVFFAGLFTRH